MLSAASGGSAAIVFGGGNGNDIINGVSNGPFNNAVTFGAGVTIDGKNGGLVEGQFINDGTIAADGGGTITVAVPLSNQGTVSASNGSTLNLENVSNLSSGTLTGGTWQATAGGNLEVNQFSPSGTIVTNNAVLVLGANSAIDNLSSGAGYVYGLTRNGATGSLTLNSGGTVSTFGGAFTNDGTLNLGAGTTLATGSFTQPADGTLAVQLATPTSFGAVTAAGTASVAGALLANTAPGANLPVGTNVNIVTSGTALSGTFSPFTNLSPLPLVNDYSSTTDDIFVGPASTSTSITSTSASGYHQTTRSASNLISLSASVAATNGASVNGGAVTFSIYQGSTLVGTAVSGSVANGVATATFDVTGLAIGSYTIKASFGNSANFASGTASNTGALQIVNPLTAPQMANVSAVALTSAATQSVSFTPPTTTDPMGAATWSFSANGVTFTNLNGTWSGTNFPVGTTTVTGTAKDAFGNSISQTFTVTVTPAAKTGAIQAVGSKFGKATSFTQTVSISQLAAGTYYYALSGLPTGVTVTTVTGGTVTTYNNLPAIKFTVLAGGTTNLTLTFSDPSAIAFNQYQWSIGT